MEYLIREYSHKPDVDGLIRIWLSALPDDFLSQLGSKFIGEVYIPELLSSPDSLGYVATESNEIRGFVLACNSKGLLLRVVAKHLPAFIVAWISALVTAPLRVVVSTSSVASYLIRSAFSPIVTEEYMELCYIAMHQNCRGQGVGRALVERLHSGISTRTNAKALSVKTLLGKGRGRAGSFYEMNGFKVKKISGSRVTYTKDIDKHEPPVETFIHEQ